MVSKSTLTFLEDLKYNNNREWFQNHKDRYEVALDEFYGLTEQLLTGISEFDEGVRMSFLEAKQCVMRIYRDTRFSADKSPYKDHFFCFMNRAGRKSPYAGYYLNLAPGGQSFLGGGVYMPDSGALKAMREGISQAPEKWLGIAEQKDLFDAFPNGIQAPSVLKRPPRGWADDHPAIGFLKFKGFYTQRFISDDEIVSDEFVGFALAAYRKVSSLVGFLNTALDDFLRE